MLANVDVVIRFLVDLPWKTVAIVLFPVLTKLKPIALNAFYCVAFSTLYRA